MPAHVDFPIGVLPGTITATDVKCDRFDFDVVWTVLTIRCDDVRWLEHTTTLYLRDPRRLCFAQVLGVRDIKHEAFCGLRGMFAFDIFEVRRKIVSIIAWGTHGCSSMFQSYLKTCDPKLVAKLKHSCGVLPYCEPPQASLGVYR